jgi:hypothetical protein
MKPSGYKAARFFISIIPTIDGSVDGF